MQIGIEIREGGFDVKVEKNGARLPYLEKTRQTSKGNSGGKVKSLE